MFFLAIEPNYDGPHLVDGKVTLGFIDNLVVAYQEQKKLPKKYVCQVVTPILHYLKFSYILFYEISSLSITFY